MLINLSIYSKNSNSLTNFLKFFYKLKSNKVFNFQLVNTQSQKKKDFFFFSVLRSPHVNKKSQEQFEYSVYKKQLKIRISRIIQFLIICKLINVKNFHDIHFRIKFSSDNLLQQRYLDDKVSSDLALIKIVRNKKFLFSNVTNQLSLQLLDFQGEILLKSFAPV